MLYSMTGFGAAGGRVLTAAGEVELEITLRSVNHRHLQVKARLGNEFAALEGEVEKYVRGRLARGSVGVHLNLERAVGTGPVRVDEALARTYLSQLNRLAVDLGLESNLDLKSLAAMPGVLSPKDELRIADEDMQPALMETLGRALEALIAMRGTEGQALLADLHTNLAALKGIAAQIAQRMPEVVQEHKLALMARINELVADGTVAPADLAREIAVLSDRLDVAEELSRLDSHLAQFNNLLEAGEASQGQAVGRKLDFLCQELFRELNTIGSKCNDAAVAHLVVDAKTHAERLREQVQNVE